MATAKDTIKSAVITNQTGSSWNNERASFSLCILSRYSIRLYQHQFIFLIFSFLPGFAWRRDPLAGLPTA
jgi:hypothetical protein